jgi:metal transporter CNNM
MDETIRWIGIALCLTQSATFSGLNLALFSISRLHLEAAAEGGDRDAERVLALRRDANYTLVTILLGNVAINVLLTLLAESLMAGVAAFLLSTLGITIFGEIFPQAYFSRHALRVASFLSPLLRFYRLLLWPIARPVGKLLDRTVGPEGILWFREAELQDVLRQHARSAENEVGKVEAAGAINFLQLDDLPVSAEGEPVDPQSIIQLEYRDGTPRFPMFEQSADDGFVAAVARSGKKWAIITDQAGVPRAVLNTNEFLRGVFFAGEAFNPATALHHPLVVRSGEETLGAALGRLSVYAEHPGDDVIDEDLILLWTPERKRIVTGADVLGRLMRGIARVRR